MSIDRIPLKQEPGPARATCRSVRVLLVDDSPADLALTRRMLAAAEPFAEIVAVNCGEQALACLRLEGQFAGASVPALVITDLNMPRMDGIEVLKRIKADPALQTIPVILMTSSAEENDVARAYAAQANAYVRKPRNVDSLKAVVARLAEFWISAAVLPNCPFPNPEREHCGSSPTRGGPAVE